MIRARDDSEMAETVMHIRASFSPNRAVLGLTSYSLLSGLSPTKLAKPKIRFEMACDAFLHLHLHRHLHRQLPREA